jgi:hypothetical protein
MRSGLVLAALVLLLSGCYAPQSGPGYDYAQPGYPPGPGYGEVPPGYPADAGGYYAPGPYGAPVYPGYSENNGVPTIIEGGAALPLVLMGGEWGYYDSGRHWHHAPDAVSRHLEERRGSAAAFHPGGPPRHDNPQQPRPDGRPPGQPNGQPSFFHSNEPGRQPAPPPGSLHPAEPGRPPAPPPSFPHPTGQTPGAPPSFFHPAAQAAPAPSPAPRPAPAAPPPHEEHARGHDCPPGQRC